MEDSEKRKVVELLKEMRNGDCVEGNKSTKEESRLNWMYKGPSELVDREEYLLGKVIDKSFELLNSGGNNTCLGSTSEQSNVPKRLLEKTDNTEQVDIAKKILEDPLYAIKQKEMEARKKLLNNPVKLKQIQQMLLERSIKDKLLKKVKKKKSKKDKSSTEILNLLIIQKLKKFSDKEKRKALNQILVSDSDYSSSESTSHEREERKKKKKKSRYHVSSSEETDSNISSEDILKKKSSTKENKKNSAKKRSGSSYDSSSSDSSNFKNETKKKNSVKKSQVPSKSSHNKHLRKSSTSSNSTTSSSDSENSDDSEKVKKAKKSKDSLKKSKVSKTNHKRRHSNETEKQKKCTSTMEIEEKHKTRKTDVRSDSSNKHKKSKRTYGLMMPDGSKPVFGRRSSPVKKYEKNTETKGKYVPPPKARPLSEREMQEKLKEMQENAKLRKEDREKNLAKHRKTQSQEEDSKVYDDGFMRRQISLLTSQGTMADRIKSKINNIQRSKSSMDSNFVRK